MPESCGAFYTATIINLTPIILCFIFFILLASFRFLFYNMVSVGADVGKSSGFDASQKAAMATKTKVNGAQIASRNKNIETLGKLP